MSDTDSVRLRKYLFDIAKIVDGAANADHAKVLSYCQQLSDRLETDGELDGAKRIRQILGKSKAGKLALARSTNGTAAPNSATQVPVDSESRLPMADEIHPRPEEVPMFLPPEETETVNKFLTYYRAADRLIANGVGISASLLLFGPPGCGKTQLARFIAAELSLPLITARTDGLISSYLGSTAKNIRLLFDHAMSRPCVLFLDEFDAVAKMRDDSRELGELKRVVISLLQNIDAMETDHVLIAATNHDHLLDPAIWRRFAYKIRLTEPTAELREQMLRSFFNGFAVEDTVRAIAALTDGVSGAQLRELADDCIRQAVLSGKTEVPLREAIHAALAANPKTARTVKLPLSERLRAVRDFDSRFFTQNRLAEVFGISQPQVCKLLKEP